MKTALALLLAVCTVTACSDDTRPPADPIEEPPIDEDPPMEDPPMEEMATFTSYVKALIVTQTSNTLPPRPYTEFATLPDPDGAANNLGAFSSLF